MTLPYAVLIPLMSDGEHGALTGFFSLTRVINTVGGPARARVIVLLALVLALRARTPPLSARPRLR